VGELEAITWTFQYIHASANHGPVIVLALADGLGVLLDDQVLGQERRSVGSWAIE